MALEAALPKPAVMIAAGVAACAVAAALLVLRARARGRKDPVRLLPNVDVAAYNDFYVGP